MMVQKSGNTAHTTFNLEESMSLGINHLENLVDSTGQPYFDVFMTKPAEAVHDWPDFVDLPSRYLEASVMIRQMLGIKVATEDVLRRRLFSTFRSDGFAHRPETPYSRPEVNVMEQALVLKALNTMYMDNPEPEVSNSIRGLVDAISSPSIKKEDRYFLLRPIVQSWMTIRYAPALDMAKEVTDDAIHRSKELSPDGSYSGHNHAHLALLAGLLSYGIVTGDTDLIHEVRKSFDFCRSMSTSFGFVPELIKRPSDIVGCETCAIMDYLDVAILLARYGYPQYWDIVEKTTRNHLVESQIKSASWLSNEPQIEDTDRTLYRDVGKKVIGAFAGWSSPDHYLAYEDELWPSWCKDEKQHPYYLGKIRALQNCCAGSGLRAIFQVWRNIAYFLDDDLFVNLHIDKLIPGVSIIGCQPYEGRTVLRIERGCDAHIRIPSFVGPSEIKMKVNGINSDFTHQGVYATLKGVKAGTDIEMIYPLPMIQETVSIGNPGYQSYGYSVLWRGDTVVKAVPDAKNPTIGYSDLIKRNVRLYYSGDGPGTLYDRGYLLERAFTVQPAPVSIDTSTVDWYSMMKKEPTTRA